LKKRIPLLALAALGIVAAATSSEDLGLADGVARTRSWLAQRIAEERGDAPGAVVLQGYRRDYDQGKRWSSADVVDLLRRWPNGHLEIGPIANYPIGSPLYRGIGHEVDDWQAAIAKWNAGHEQALDASRLCIDWRPDLVVKHIDGSDGETSCGTLLGEARCAPNPCRDHPDNPCRRWEGDMARDWGADAARFDTAWLLKTPAATWRKIVDKYYDGQDFCDGKGHEWGEVAHRSAICRAMTPESKLVLYGKTDARKRRLAFVSGVGLDLRIAAAREWNARRLLSSFVDLGFAPGEPACVIMGYKPGLWSFYDGPEAGDRCPADEANSWSGFETPQNAGRCWGGAVVPTPYGPGEFERAMNEQMRAVFRLLDGPVPAAVRARAGPAAAERWGAVRFITTERPSTRGRIWWIWDADVRARLTGEMQNRPSGLD
jgi:hypothetical protein